jgi:hypothetical protein
LINANKNNIPLSDVYGTVVSTSGVYQLRFEGAYSDINLGMNFDDGLKKKYIKSINRHGLEKGFLLFLKDNGIKGVSLYKQNDDGTVDKKSLDSNNKKITTPCP